MKSLFFPLFILILSCLLTGCLAAGIGAGISSETLITEKLSSPTLVTFSPDPTNNNKPTLDWRDVTGATKYHIQIDDNPEFTSPVVDEVDVSLSTFTSPPLPDETYFWRVSSMDDVGNESDFSSVDSFTVDTEPPSVPTFVPYDPDPTNDNTPILDWDDMKGAVKYHIQIDNDSDFSSTLVDDSSVPLSTYTPLPLLDGTYFWRVRSIDEAGNESDFSSTDNFTVDTEAPEVPTLIPYSPDPTNNKTPTLNWIDVVGAFEYNILIDDDSDFTIPVVDTSVSASTFTPSLLTDGTYYWKLKSIDEAGNESDFSSPDSFTLDTLALEAPTLVTFTPDPTSNNMPTLDWDNVTGAVKYRIQIDDDSDFSSPVIDDNNMIVSDYTPTSILSDRTYYWRVSSIDEPGNTSSFSEADVFTVDTTAPTVPTLVPHPDPTNDPTPTLDWNDITGAVKHHIQIDNNLDFNNPVVDDNSISVSTYTSSALSDGTYYWRVNSIDAAGNESDFSSAANFTVDTIVPATNTINYVSGSTIIESTQIVISFSKSMNPSTLSLGGTMDSESDGGVWSTTASANDTLTVSPNVIWTDGVGKTLTIDARDIAGSSLSTLSLNYGVFTGGIVYVRDSDGNDTNLGTSTLPKKTIQAAIDLADSLYTTAEVHVAEGTYNVSYQAGTHVIMKEGISIYGGYSSSDWNTRDPNIYTITIQDTSTSGGGNQAIHAEGGITAITIIDGFTISGGGYGIYTLGSATIRNNTIYGGGGGSFSYGIYTLGSATIENNTINGGSGGSFSYGIYTLGSATIRNNTIYGGSGSSNTIIIYTSGSTTIQNNIIFASGTNGTCINEAFSDPLSVQNNDLFDCSQGIYRDDDGNCPGGVICNLAEMEALTDMTVSGNASDTPTFVNKNGPDGNINTMEDNDWRLQPSSPINVRQGGLDGSAEGWGFTTDKDGVTRTAPWSMGAYEKN